MQPPVSATVTAVADASASRLASGAVQSKTTGPLLATLHHIVRNSPIEFVVIAGPLVAGTALVHRGFVFLQKWKECI
eukprot:IDg15062t1